MKTKLIKFFNLIKKDKQAKILTIMGVLMLFIFTIGYSLSMFTTSQNKKITNIKVNDLSFNITTNSGTSNDRILHLQAGKLEQFNIILTNLNKIDVKYEFTYELCNNQNCTETSNNIPSDISVSKEDESSEVSGTINTNKTKSLTILTNNKSNNDYYIKLNLNAGYVWNDLELANQINDVVSLDKDIDIVAYVDGVEVKELPTTCFYNAVSTAYKNNTELKDSPVSFNCNYATGKWDINVSNLDNIPNKLVVNFESKGINAVEYVSKVQELDSDNKHGLFIDPTVDKNVRYTGSEPKNYVEFGNDGELWRIIGIFNTTDSSGATSKKLKLVRDESLGNYSWDATGNDNYGYNDWTQADLMKELNGDYLDISLTENNPWYNSMWNDTNSSPVIAKSAIFDYTKTIKNKYQQMISSSVWKLGANSWYPAEAPLGLYTLTQYNAERSTTTYQNSLNTIWIGKIALFYASDFGYASSDINCRENIRSGAEYTNNIINLTNVNCKNNNWMFKNDNTYYWTLSPYSLNNNCLFNLNTAGTIDHYYAFVSFAVRPSLHLNSNIRIISGIGEKDNPYKFV